MSKHADRDLKLNLLISATNNKKILRLRVKFLIAPDSFKESMSAYQASLTIEQAIKANIDNAETLLLPMADGGEGTLSVLVQSLNGKTETFEVTGPFVSGFRVNAYNIK